MYGNFDGFPLELVYKLSLDNVCHLQIFFELRNSKLQVPLSQFPRGIICSDSFLSPTFPLVVAIHPQSLTAGTWKWWFHGSLRWIVLRRAAFVSGGLMSIFSGIPIAIGGTDLNPAVFYGDFVVAIAEDRGRELCSGFCSLEAGGWSLLVVGVFSKKSVFLPQPQTKVGAWKRTVFGMGVREVANFMVFGSVVGFSHVPVCWRINMKRSISQFSSSWKIN